MGAGDSDTDDGDGNISGASVLVQLQLVEAALGPTQFATLMARLAPDDRARLDGLTPVGWVPIALSDRLLAAAADVAGRAPDAFRDEIVGASTAQNFKTVWRVLLAVTSDAALVSRAGAMIHRVYDRGEVHVRMVAPGHAELVVSRWPSIPDRALHGMRIAIQKVLELARRRDVRAAAARTPDGARYDLRWRA
jgi:hypothetical protein